MSLKTIMITGGAGFIGYHLAKHFHSLDRDVICFDSYTNYCSPLNSNYADFLTARLTDLDDKATCVRGDIRDRGQIERTIRQFSPDVVVHLAAIPISKSANLFSEEAVQINVNGTANVLEAIRSAGGVQRFVFVSSSCVYGDFQMDSASESHPLNPIDVYGATKLSGEMLTKGFGTRFGIEYSIVRPSAVYGPADANQRVAQIMIENAMAGRPLTMHNGGHNSVDFTYVDDTVSGIALAALHANAIGNVFNITRGEGKSIRSLVEILRERFGDLQVIESGQDERRPIRGTLDITKARQLLGYSPQYDLAQGINRYIDRLLDGYAEQRA